MNNRFTTKSIAAKRFTVKSLILSFCLLLFIPFVSAQEEEYKPPKNYAVTWEQVSLLFGGLKFGFDMRVQDKNWIQIIPTAYLYPGLSSYTDWGWDDYDYYDYDNDYYILSSHGFGIDLNYKRFLNKKEFIYCHGGINYSFLKTSFQYYDWISYIEDGLTYYNYKQVDETQHFNRIGAAACFGIQTPMEHGFYIDGYIGLGYRYAFYDENKPALDYGVYDYGYRGFYPEIGFRLGIAFAGKRITKH